MAIESFKFKNDIGISTDEDFYIQGRNFSKAADILKQEIELSIKKKGVKDINLYIPWITIQAFSCELYLKSILINDGKECIKTHSLRKLFCTINGKKRTEIMNNAKTGFLAYAHQDYQSYNFCRLLKIISNSFEDWRYCIEGKKELEISLTFLKCFSFALEKNINENTSYEYKEDIAIIKVLDE